MKSIVASARAFMIDATKGIGALCMGPLARICCISSAIPIVVLCPAVRVAGVISPETLSCSKARRFSGLDTAHSIQLDQT